MFTDFTIAGQRVECSECKCEYMRLKALKEAAQAHNPRAQRLAELKAQMQASSYRGSTLDAKVNKLWFERYPGLAIRIPAVLTKRKGVSNELMMMLARAARTPQGSHDLEAALHEYRALANYRECQVSSLLLLRAASLSLAGSTRNGRHHQALHGRYQPGE